MYNPFQTNADLTTEVNIIQDKNMTAGAALELIDVQSSFSLKYLFVKGEKFAAFSRAEDTKRFQNTSECFFQIWGRLIMKLLLM